MRTQSLTVFVITVVVFLMWAAVILLLVTGSGNLLMNGMLVSSTVANTVMLTFQWRSLQRNRRLRNLKEVLDSHKSEGRCSTCRYMEYCEAARWSVEEILE